MTTSRDISLAWNDWVTSDAYRELGNRVRWSLVEENRGEERERYWSLVLGRFSAAEPRPKAIVDVPVQLNLLGAA